MTLSIAKLLARRARVVLAISVLAAVGLGAYAVGVPGDLELGSGGLPGSDAARTADALEVELDFDPEAAYTLLVESDAAVGPDTVAVAVRALRAQIGAIEHVERAGRATEAPSGARSIAIFLDPGTSTEGALETGEALREDLDAGPFEVSVAGDVAISDAARSTLLDEAPRLELIVAPFVLLVLTLALGWRLALATLLGALLAAGASVAALGAANTVAPIYVVAVPVAVIVAFAGAIGLSATLARRWREESGSMGEGPDALGYSLAIVLRGLAATVIAVAGLCVVTLLVEVGAAGSIGVAALAATLLAPLGLVPAAAAIAAGALRGGGEPLPLVGSDSDQDVEADRARAPRIFGTAVAIARSRRRAVLAVVPPIAVALLLAVPLLDGDSVGLAADELPRGDETRAAEAALAESFGRGASAPIVVAAEGTKDDASVTAQREAIAGIAGVEDVTPAGNAGPFARYAAISAAPPRSLAAERVAGAIEGLELEGDPRLTGPTATLREAGERLDSRLPAIGGAALVVVAILWGLWFRGVAAAALALIAPLGALAGAGAATYVATEGAFEDLLGYRSAGAPELLGPLIIAAILLPIGFAGGAQLAAALREERVLGGGSAGALARSATLSVTPALTAALCGLGISAAWLGSDLAAAQQVGLGIGVGLVVEALIVRPLVAPGLAGLLQRG